MYKEPKISVIIPVYNVEAYLNRCVESIVNQTYNNLEIILVDDGSPDKCSQICDDWEKRDKRIVVIHKENGGLSSARNTGLSVAHGDYIAFVDSDDYISPKMLDILMASVMDDDVDVAVCGVEEFDDYGNYRRFRSVDEKMIVNGAEALANIFQGNAMIAVMNRLYSKKSLHNIWFAEGKLYEDVIFDADLFTSTREIKVSILPETGYYYYRRANSIMGETENKQPSMDLLKAYSYLYKKIEKLQKEKRKIITTFSLYYLLSFGLEKNNLERGFKKELRILVRCNLKYQDIFIVGIRYKLKSLCFAYGLS